MAITSVSVKIFKERAKRIPEIRQADCVVVNGDLTIRGGRSEALSVVDALSELNGQVYAHIGNMDEAEVDVMFTEMGINLNGRGVLLNDVGLFGLGGSPPTPFNTPSEFSIACPPSTAIKQAILPSLAMRTTSSAERASSKASGYRRTMR